MTRPGGCGSTGSSRPRRAACARRCATATTTPSTTSATARFTADGRQGRALPRGPRRRSPRRSRSTRRCRQPARRPGRSCGSSCSTPARAPAPRSPTRSPASPRRSIQLGVPAVVAMQFEISDAAPPSCSPRSSTPTSSGARIPIDAAVAEARKAIYSEVDKLEWATPVLFLRDPGVDAVLVRGRRGPAPGGGADGPADPVGQPVPRRGRSRRRAEPARHRPGRRRPDRARPGRRSPT